MNKSENDAVKQLRKFEVSCPNCKKSSPLSRWGFVQTNWYERPRGCIEGDNWWPEEDINQCLLICPNNCHVDEKNNPCNLATRIMDLPMQRAEREQVFGTIKLVTGLEEQKLCFIFDGHYVQYGSDGKISSSEELREERKAELEIDF